MADLSPGVVAVVAGMAAVTYATKAGGLWALGRVEVSSRVETALEALPGAVVVAVLAVELAAGGPREWAAVALVVAVAARTDSGALALAAGVGAVALLRAV